MQLPFEIVQSSCNVTSDTYQVAPHRHQFYQWYCVLEGEVNYTVEGKDYLLKPFESILISPNQLRSVARANVETKYFAIGFHVNRIEMPSFTYELVKIPVGMETDLRELFVEAKKPHLKYAGDYFLLLFARIIYYVLRQIWQGQQESAKFHYPNQDIVDAIDHYLKINVSSPVSREDLCRITGYSPAQVARIYKKSKGRTIHEQLTIYRISAAETYLTQSSVSISSIALLVGFNSFSHFSQLFKEKNGVSPSEFRSQMENPRA